MSQTIEQLSEMLAEAKVNDRFYFALLSKSGMPHYFRVQKLHLADNTNYTLYALTDDEGFMDKIYNAYRFRDLFQQTRNEWKSVARIIWEYLRWYNAQMSKEPPLALGKDQAMSKDEKWDSEAFEVFLRCKLIDVAQY